MYLAAVIKVCGVDVTVCDAVVTGRFGADVTVYDAVVSRDGFGSIVICFIEGLSTLLQRMGRAYQSLASYECHKALEQFSDLPPRHHNTGWVLVQVAKAHFELAQYQKVEFIL